MSCVINVENIGKKYLLSHQAKRESYLALRDVLADGAKSMGRRLLCRKGAVGRDAGREEFWALKELSFDVQRGDRIGIIGRNGAGKSTLLKILSRITEPTTGSVRIRGRVASLLEVGTGFHPELTGRENIYLNGAILGMGRSEIRRKFDEIVDFAEIEKFLDTPVKRYSSGMYVRLAFAVAAHLEPEILIVDEVLAVGDVQFQKKCMGKMEEISSTGRTLIFVSHNMGAINELCNKAILLNRGNLKAIGKTNEIISDYLSMFDGDKIYLSDISRHRNELCEISDLTLFNNERDHKNRFNIGESVNIKVCYSVKQAIEGLQITATLIHGTTEIFHTFHTDEMDYLPAHQVGDYAATLSIPSMLLKAGSYRVSITAGTPQQLLVDLQNAVFFDVNDFSVNTTQKGYRKDRLGQIIFPGTWKNEKIDEI